MFFKSQEDVSDYFIERYKEEEEKANKMTAVRERQLKNIYRTASKELQTDLADFIQKYGLANNFTRADVEKFLNTKELAEFRYSIEDYIKKIDELGGTTEEALKLKKELDILAGRTRVTRMEVLKSSIDYQLGKVAQLNIDEIDGHLKDVVQFAYTDSHQIIKPNSFAMLDPEKINRIVNQNWTSEHYSKRVWKNSRKGLARKVMKAITVGMAQGHDFARISTQFAKLMNQGYYESRRIIETETTYALERAKEEAFKEMKVTEYTFVAKIDKDTSPICRKLNGQVFKMKDRHIGKNCPPMHPFCRSVSVPKIDKKQAEETMKLIKAKQENRKTREERDAEDIKQIMKGINFSKGTRKTNAKKLLDNVGLKDVKVHVKKLEDAYGVSSGYVQTKAKLPGKKHEWNIKRVTDYSLLKDDDRDDEAKRKTMFHELYHSLSADKRNDSFTEFGVRQTGNLVLEETFAESSANYLYKASGGTKEMFPSYPEYLSKVLPRLKKFRAFKNCETIEDFGKKVFHDRFHGKNAMFVKQHDLIMAVPFDFQEYFGQYDEFLKANKDKVINLIKEADPFEAYYARKACEAYLKGEVVPTEEEFGFQSLLTALMKLKGVL